MQASFSIILSPGAPVCNASAPDEGLASCPENTKLRVGADWASVAPELLTRLIVLLESIPLITWRYFPVAWSREILGKVLMLPLGS